MIDELRRAAAGLLRRLRRSGDHARYASIRREPVAGEDRGLVQLLNLLDYAKTSGASYDGRAHPAGYHTLVVNGVRVAGQRQPDERIRLVPYDFSGKTVLDIGCNQGGMLFEIAGQIRHGTGIDYATRSINAANKLRSIRRATNLDFFVFDLDQEDLERIRDFLPEEKVDIAFLLSVCMWIRNWRAVIDLMPRIAHTLLFESNGSATQQDEQLAYLRLRYTSVQLLSGRSADDKGQAMRQLYLCS